MKPIVMTLVVPCVIVTLWTCGRAQEWRRITPLKSTRPDVEAILGQAKGHYSTTYQLKEGSLLVQYSVGPCTPGRREGWNVPTNVVVSLLFSPRTKKRIDDLQLDPKKFRTEKDEHSVGFIYYIDDEDGIVYAVEEGILDYIAYGPGRKHHHLYCGDVLKKP